MRLSLLLVSIDELLDLSGGGLHEWAALKVGAIRQHGQYWYKKISGATGRAAWVYYATAGTEKGKRAAEKAKKQVKRGKTPPSARVLKARVAKRRGGSSPGVNRKAPLVVPQAPQAPTKNPSGGTPVSAALSKNIRAPSGAHRDNRKRLTRALQLIDKVHSDGALPKMKMTQRATKGTHGHFMAYADGRVEEININPEGDHPELTALHEIGHFIDFAGFSKKRGYASETDDPLMNKLTDKIKSSWAYKKLQSRHTKATAAKSSSARYYKYLLSTKECFARAYAQYIASRSEDPTLKHQLDNQRTRKPGLKYNPKQWDDDDFEPIARAFDRVFHKKGWLKEKPQWMVNQAQKTNPVKTKT